MRILSIGNSFSSDATKYLYEIAKSGGVDIQVVNLYIGGCSLYRHVKNLRSGEAAYSCEINGQPTAESISIQEAVAWGKWDVITLQQVSGHSGIEATYQPFLGELAAYLRQNAPEARLFIHKTWAYDPKSDHNDFPIYHSDTGEMFQKLSDCVQKAANDIDAGIIPVGDAIEKLRKTTLFTPEGGAYQIHRDGFHLSIPYGRYFAGLIWAETLLGLDVRGNGFVPPCKLGRTEKEILAFLQGLAHEYAV